MSATRPLRVGLATDWYLPRLGGIELHVSDLARAIRGRGHRATVLTTTPADEHEEANVVRIATTRLPGADIAISPSLVRRVRDRLDADRIDVLHAHVSVISPLAYAAVVAARAANIPSVVTFHSALHSSARMLAYADRIIRWREWDVAITAVSGMLARQLREAMPGLRVSLLPNGIDVSAWRSRPRARDGEMHVVTAMRLHRKKRPLALLQAFAQARASGCPITLGVFGDGPERPSLERWVRRRDLRTCIHFHGARPRRDLRDAYARAHLFALPSRLEAFGLAALEARCAGLPVVAMRSSGVGDFLEHQRNALLADDDEQLAEHITRLARDDSLRTSLAAMQGDVLRYDWSEVAATHLECYERVTGVTPPGRSEVPPSAMPPDRSVNSNQPVPTAGMRK
jgi:glycosyltransferase involved in cell wall biosynthesis